MLKVFFSTMILSISLFGQPNQPKDSYITELQKVMKEDTEIFKQGKFGYKETKQEDVKFLDWIGNQKLFYVSIDKLLGAVYNYDNIEALFVTYITDKKMKTFICEKKENCETCETTKKELSQGIHLNDLLSCKYIEKDLN